MNIRKRRFGRLGWEISEVGFGAWAIGSSWGEQSDEESLKALHKALDEGLTFIDTAAVYGDGRSEKLIGKVLKDRGVKIGEVRVASKIPPRMEEGMAWPPRPRDLAEDRYPEKYLREGVEKSLKNLGVEALDLIQLHSWTRAWNENPTPLVALRKLQEEGKVLGIGISTPEPDQNSLVQPMRDGLLDSVQLIYNVFDQEPEAELLPVAKANDVAVIVRCALDEGALTGKFTRDTQFGEGDFRAGYFRGHRLGDVVDRVEAFKKDMEAVGEKNLASAALRFVLAHDAVSVVIPGMRSEFQVLRNLESVEAEPLSGAALEAARRHFWRRMYWHD